MLLKPSVGGSWGRAVGWNAGAVGVPVLAVDVRMDYQPETGLVGVVIGLRPSDSNLWITPGRITHGFYCYTQSGSYATPIERNILKGTPFTYASGDTLSIVRDGGVVTYLHNGSLVYTSAKSSSGLVRVATCLFAAGDAVT